MKKITVAVFFGALIYLGLVEYGFSQSPFYQGKTLPLFRSLVPAAPVTCGAELFFLFCRNTFQATRPLFPITCRAGAGEKRQIIFTVPLVLTA